MFSWYSLYLLNNTKGNNIDNIPLSQLSFTGNNTSIPSHFRTIDKSFKRDEKPNRISVIIVSPYTEIPFRLIIGFKLNSLPVIQFGEMHLNLLYEFKSCLVQLSCRSFLADYLSSFMSKLQGMFFKHLIRSRIATPSGFLCNNYFR